MVAVSLAADDVRLTGTFKVAGTVTSTDITGLSPGDKTKDVYEFKPTCNHGVCDNVKLTRDRGSAPDVKSTVKRIKPGVYKGTEGPEPYTCLSPFGDPGTFTGVNEIKITDSSHGKPTKISGTSKIKLHGCDETFENTSIKGTLK